MMVAVIIRVYSRIKDLEICLDIIRRYWTHNKYFLIVVSNGLQNGHIIPASCRKAADLTIELEENAGHLKGNSQLILAGLDKVGIEYDYTILLEADNWLFDDTLICKYLEKMQKENAVWASAEWIEKYYSLALDFAIVRTNFIKKHPEIFNFTIHAESYVCNHIRMLKEKYVLISECMPVHIPKLLRIFHNPSKGRVRSFDRALMVTHHVEELPSGLEEKKTLANIVLGRKEFDVQGRDNIRFRSLKLRIFLLLVRICPRSTWFKKKRTNQSLV